MTIEKINASQPVTITPNVEKPVEEDKVVQKSSGSTKDVVTVLSVLAAIGAAGVAIYKHRDAKKAVEEAKNEAKKKVEEAEEKAKKAAEDIEKKIQEAVDKVKNEYEKNTKSPKKSAEETNTSPVKPQKKTKTKKRKNNNPVNRPQTENKGYSQNLEGNNLDTDLGEIDEALTNRINASQNGIIVVPESTKTANTVGKVINKIKGIFKRKSNGEPSQVRTPEPVKPQTDTAQPESVEPIFKYDNNASVKILEGGIKDKDLEVLDGNLVQNIRNSRNGIIVVPTTTGLSRFIQRTTDSIKDRYKKYTQKFKQVMAKKPVEEQKPAAEVKNPQKVEPQNVINKTKPEVEAIVEDTEKQVSKPAVNAKKEAAEQKIKNQIIDRILNIATDEQLITEYNRLKDRVSKKAVTDIESKVFLAIKGELLNHRNYRFTGKELNPIKKDGLAAKRNIEKQLSDNSADYATQAESLINTPYSKEKHNAIQALYDTLAKEEQKVYEFKGIELPDVKQISEQNLVTEYNALKDFVKGLAVAEPASKRFLEIQGELINHRGYGFKNGKLVKKSAEQIKPETETTKQIITEEAKAKVQKLEEQLDGSVTVNVPRKPRKTWHNKIQKQLDKLLGIKTEEKTAWQKEIEEDKKRYAALVKKAKEANNAAEEKRINAWKENSDNVVESLEQKLDGSITAQVSKKPTNYEHKQLQKEYDELGRRLQETDWKENAKSTVQDYEQKLDGSITAQVSKKPTNYEHKQLQKEYDELGRRLQEADWKENAKSTVQDYEQKLDGSITAQVSKKPTNYEHKQLQKEYDKLAIKSEITEQKPVEEIVIDTPKVEVQQSTPIENLSKTNANADNSKILEGGIKDTELDVLDGNLVESIRNSKNGIIIIPSATKISKFVQKSTDAIKDRYVNYKNRFKQIFGKQKESVIQPNLPEPKVVVQEPIALKPEVKVEKPAVNVNTEMPERKEIVNDIEKQLDGSISVQVSKKPTNYKHKQLQKEYDELGRKLQEADWKENAKSIVQDYEQKLDGSIAVNVTKKPTSYNHQQLQKEYDELAILPEKMARNVEQEKNQAQEVSKKVVDKAEPREKPQIISAYKKPALETTELVNGQLSIQPERTYTDTDDGKTVVRNVVKGLNELPESFNQSQRILANKQIRHRQEKVTEYPKLYAGAKERKAAMRELFSNGIPSKAQLSEFFRIMREEKAAKKEMQRLKKEHIERRYRYFREQTGMGSEETALTNNYLVPEDTKFSARKYKSMSKERPTEKDWEVEMTREEFMKNKAHYVEANYHREYLSQMKHGQQKKFNQNKKTFFGKIKKWLGLN